MVYTEIKERNNRNYFYRVTSIRKGKKVGKKRIYLGVNLSEKDLINKEREADKEFLKERNKQTEVKIEELKKKIIPILESKKIKKAGIFGSYAIGKQKKNSDIDILIEFNGSLLDLVSIENKLQENLRKKVDLLTYSGIYPLLKKRILEQEVRII